MWEKKILRKCPACKGTGLAESGRVKSSGENFSQENLESMMFLAQGICLACRGKGEVRV